jgi:acyl-CoA dehydrogenase
MLDHIQIENLKSFLRNQNMIGSSDLVVQVLSGGQSNPTYILQSGSTEFVLRRKPFGPILASAHATDREYRVMHALSGTDVPVPEMHLYAQDKNIIGAEFYLMEYVKGRVFVDQTLPDLTKQERGDIYQEMNRVISNLHQVNFNAIGLSDYGRSGNYFSRQIGRWSKQSLEGEVVINQSMRNLIEWLPENIPQQEDVSIVHGDFRIDNLIFHPKRPEVIAVLDWELSTLGDPLADFFYHCMAWKIPYSLWRGISGADLKSLGIPELSRYVELYLKNTNRTSIGKPSFYLAYNLFRMAGILYGIANRVKQGNAASQDAYETSQKAGPLADIGWDIAMGKIEI